MSQLSGNELNVMTKWKGKSRLPLFRKWKRMEPNDLNVSIIWASCGKTIHILMWSKKRKDNGIRADWMRWNMANSSPYSNARNRRSQIVKFASAARICKGFRAIASSLTSFYENRPIHPFRLFVWKYKRIFSSVASAEWYITILIK